MDRCRNCGSELTTGGCVSCGAQRTYCGLCGKELYSPKFEHDCPCITIIQTIVVPIDEVVSNGEVKP